MRRRAALRRWRPIAVNAFDVSQASRASGVLILSGPTASGKTGLAIELARRYGAEIVGADARQIYRGMPIGTAAPTAAQRAQIPHHLIDFVDPYERYSAARFVVDAASAIAGIHARAQRAIVVGGTGFYLRALCGDIGLAAEPDPVLRARVAREALAHPPDVLYAWLRARAPERAAAISVSDRYRVVRALEIDLARTRGADRSASPQTHVPTLRGAGIAFVKLALRVDATALAARIEERTDAMLAAGLIEEAERIGADAIAADAVGYREALAYREGWLEFDDLRRLLARNTRRYAKRQLTWLRSEPDVVWIAAGDLDRIAAEVARLGWGT
jgi:tRNA dimethylallyltransferase